MRPAAGRLSDYDVVRRHHTLMMLMPGPCADQSEGQIEGEGLPSPLGTYPSPSPYPYPSEKDLASCEGFAQLERFETVGRSPAITDGREHTKVGTPICGREMYYHEDGMRRPALVAQYL